MADNFTRNKSFGPDSTTGYTEAADDVGGVWYPIQKLAFGALDAATIVSSAAGLPVEIVASIGIGGGTEYTEDAAAAANPVGGAVILIRTDTPATQVTTDGDNVAQRGTNYGAAYVQLVTSAGAYIDSVGGGTQYAVDAALGATPTGTLAVAIRDDALSALTPVEGDAIGLRVDANGALWTRDDVLEAAISGSEMQVDVVGALPAGTNAIGKLAANSGVDIGDVDVLSVVPGTAATNLGKAEDGAHTTGDVGVFALGVRNDTPNAALAGTDLDYIALATYRTGALRTAIPEEDFAALGSNHVKKYLASTGAVTDGIVWSPAAGKRWYVTDMIITTSAAATVTIEDDQSGGDVIVLALDLAANSGIAHHFATPLFSGEDAADLLITTTAGNSKITCVGYEV